eukprot:gnl/TRDRNA2_/TRDRNA2_174100_c0_seq22.p1 gnl/TRDRNA2_/TRDRNA2_174100_c0~~gnl/TRDRNA2_/TRDRNA2_174100_c0_seq22.p1  ORF type:complete len:152 (-),score=22.68 gnl/TRDRNA2_/TRDRNA2_174100_c0_seq22:521-976(-)
METSQESAADHLTRSCTMNTGDDDKTTGSAQLEDDMKYGDISSDQLACLGGWPRLILSFATYDRDVRHLSLMRTKTQEEPIHASKIDAIMAMAECSLEQYSSTCREGISAASTKVPVQCVRSSMLACDGWYAISVSLQGRCDGECITTAAM